MKFLRAVPPLLSYIYDAERALRCTESPRGESLDFLSNLLHYHIRSNAVFLTINGAFSTVISSFTPTVTLL